MLLYYRSTTNNIRSKDGLNIDDNEPLRVIGSVSVRKARDFPDMTTDRVIYSFTACAVHSIAYRIAYSS